eukprot:m.282208 g.282208  ORF g.282208 m.282208 type:complete len:111 (-) comp54937_c3_seq18:6-338(-)
MPLAQLLFWCGSTDHERLAAQQNIKPALRGPVLDNFTVGEEIRETVPIVLLEQPEAIAEEEFGMVSVSVESKSEGERTVIESKQPPEQAQELPLPSMDLALRDLAFALPE